MLRTTLFSLLILSLFSPILLLAMEERPLPRASSLQADITNYKRMNERLATSGTPEEGAITELAEKGIQMFIDLRINPDDTARTEAKAAGAHYYNIPVVGAKGISKEQLAKFTALYEQMEGKILLHCVSGNRVGGLWTAYQLSKGVIPEIAITQGRKAGMRSSLEEDVLEAYCPHCQADSY